MRLIRAIQAAALAAATALTAMPSQAADWPTRPVRIIVPSTPGGALDVLARILGPRLTEKWGQQIIVENRAGAGGIIGTDAVARSEPDGYTLLIVTNGFTNNNFLYKKIPYDVKKDFLPLTIIGLTGNVFVIHPSAKFRSVKELIALAKKAPDSITYGSSGTGTGSHLSTALLESLAGIKLTQVPYKGAGAATAAVLAGEVPMLITAIGAAIPHIKNKSIIPLAVTSAKRAAVLPDVPSMAEAGVAGYDMTAWYGMFAPAGTPKEIVDKIYADLKVVLAMPDVAKQIANVGFEIDPITPAEFGKYIDEDLKRSEATIKAAGIKPE